MREILMLEKEISALKLELTYICTIEPSSLHGEKTELRYILETQVWGYIFFLLQGKPTCGSNLLTS